MSYYTKPVYSKEQYKRWEEQEKRRHDYLNKHTHEVEKVIKIKDLYIFCTQTKYDDCLKKEGRTDTYIISVWEDKTRMNLNKNLAHEVLDNPTEANERFKFWKAQCEM